MDDSGVRQPYPVKVLVTGVDGAVGANLALGLAKRAVVHGLFQGQAVALAGCTLSRWEPADTEGLERLIAQDPPHWIVHCGALARGSWDLPQDVGPAEDEARVCAALLKAAQKVQARLTVLSTDAVFAGPRMFHEEQSLAANAHPFAEAARRVETVLEGQGVLVVRTHAYGWGSRHAEPCFAERVWQALTEGAACAFDPHSHATPILASDLAGLLWDAYRRGLQGLYHISGAERTSAYRFAGELALTLGLRAWPVPLESSADSFEPCRAAETSLNTGRARRALERPMPMLREGLERFAKQLESGLRARLQGLAAEAVSGDAA